MSWPIVFGSFLALATDAAPGLGTHFPAGFGDRVTQASGVVAVQATCSSFDAAVTLMEAHAWRTRRSLDEIASAVLDRSIRFGV
jgi:hypothetical protein